MRLIDANVLRTSIEKDRDASDMPKMWYEGIAYAINHIIHAPTADVQEVKHGRWYKPTEYPRDSYRYICTVCQEVAYFVTGNNGKKHKEDYPRCGYKYCPNCGADMRGGPDAQLD